MRFLTYARKKVRAVSAIVLLSAFGCFIWSVSYFSTYPHSNLSLSKELVINHHDQPHAAAKSLVATVKNIPRSLTLADGHLEALGNKVHIGNTSGIDRSPSMKSTPDVTKLKRTPYHIPKWYKNDPRGYARYMEYFAKTEAPLPKQTRAVIILTNHRSGSSFFGELFNQHPDAFYMFEPLFPLSNSSHCALHRELKIRTLKSLVQCTLPDWLKVYEGIPAEERITGNHNMRKCINKGICFRMNTKELCEDRHCPRSSDSSIKSCYEDCGTINRMLVENVCRRKSLVALKIIRLCDVNDIETIIWELPVDIKVLHLLRDPRGIAASRRRLMGKIDLRESLLGTCQRQANNFMTGTFNRPVWLKERYMAVRYEDTALHPYQVAHDVYKFVGLDFPDEMKRWIYDNTGIPVPSPEDIKTDSSVSETNDTSDSKSLETDSVLHSLARNENMARLHKGQKDPYGTSRDSSKTVQRWVRDLPFSTVRLVEGVCGSLMKMAGYKNVEDIESFTRNKTIKYFTDAIPLPDVSN